MAKLEPAETISGATLNERGDDMIGVLVTLPREVEVTVDHTGLYGRGAEQVFTGRDVILEDLVAQDLSGDFGMWRGRLLDPNNQPITEAYATFDVRGDEQIEVWA